MTDGRFLDTLVVTCNFLGGDGEYEAMVESTTAAAVVVMANDDAVVRETGSQGWIGLRTTIMIHSHRFF
jgi:hypothetical protein